MNPNDFYQQLLAHVGGLVRVLPSRDAMVPTGVAHLQGKTGLLLKVASSFPRAWGIPLVRVEVLIDGSIQSHAFVRDELELIGGEGSDGTDENTSQFSSPPSQPLRTEL
jgi:hypothetical protein